MTVKPGYDGGTGKPLWESDGGTPKPVWCDDCLECTHCEDCAGENEIDCPPGCCTPAEVEVVVMGVESSIPAGCYDCGTNSFSDVSVPAIDGTHTLGQMAGCVWEKELGECSCVLYLDDDDCLEEAGCAYTGTMKIVLTRDTATNYKLQIYASMDVDGGEPGWCDASIGMWAFIDLTGPATANRCDENITFNANGLSIDCYVAYLAISDSGSASTSPCP